MIPHVYWQEVYAEIDVEISPYYDGNEQVEAEKSDVVNTSPVKFFAPDIDKFPRFD